MSRFFVSGPRDLPLRSTFPTPEERAEAQRRVERKRHARGASDNLRRAFRDACAWAETRASLEGWTMAVCMGFGGLDGNGERRGVAIHIHGAPGTEAIVEEQRANGRRFRVLRVYAKQGRIK